MSQVRQKLIRSFFSVANSAIKLAPFHKLFNYVFERGTVRMVNAFVHYVKNPSVDILWTFRLSNGKTMKTRIDRNDLKTWQFAVSYQWQDPGLNVIEDVFDTHYPKDVPWFDIGANLGLRSLWALSSKRPVYFFEPNNELNEINRKRCELNSCENYTFFPVGVSDKDGELTLYIDQSSYLSSVHKDVVDPSVVVREEKIPVRSLDSVYRQIGRKFKTACVKIDTEGHEEFVIKGATDFIEELSPTMIIEINEKGENLQYFVDYFFSRGYKMFAILYETADKVLMPYDTKSTLFFQCNNFLFVKDASLLQKLDSYCYSR